MSGGHKLWRPGYKVGQRLRNVSDVPATWQEKRRKSISDLVDKSSPERRQMPPPVDLTESQTKYLAKQTAKAIVRKVEAHRNRTLLDNEIDAATTENARVEDAKDKRRLSEVFCKHNKRIRADVGKSNAFDWKGKKIYIAAGLPEPKWFHEHCVAISSTRVDAEVFVVIVVI